MSKGIGFFFFFFNYISFSKPGTTLPAYFHSGAPNFCALMDHHSFTLTSYSALMLSFIMIVTMNVITIKSVFGISVRWASQDKLAHYKLN